MTSDEKPELPTRVTIRRAPKVATFLIAGGALGLLAALVLTSTFPVDPAVGFAATFGYLALYAIPIGVALAALIALIVDRAASRRARGAIAVRETTHPDAQNAIEPPAADRD